MNNPFANFDLEESLAGLPAALRQPMVLAVAASTLVHGLAFLVLPVVTSSAESKKLPDRIVGVVELTPEQQSKLPPSMLVSQFPASSAFLPTVPGGKLPLTGLFPGMPNTNVGIPAVKNPINTLMDSIERDTQIASGNNSYYVPPVSSYDYTPPDNSVPPVKTEAQKKNEEEVTKKADVLAARRRIEAEVEAKRQLEEEANKRENQTPGTGVKVAAGQQPETAPSSANPPPATEPGAKDLKNLTPAQVAQQQQLLAATTYRGKGTTVEEQKTVQMELPGKLLAELEPELNKLPEDQRNAIVGKIAFSAAPNAPIELREFPAQAAELPPGVAAFNFENAQSPAQVEAIVQAYFTPEGKLLGRPTIVRSSGIPMLNELAIQMVEKAAADKPEKLDYQAIQFRVPYTLPKPANA